MTRTPFPGEARAADLAPQLQRLALKMSPIGYVAGALGSQFPSVEFSAPKERRRNSRGWALGALGTQIPGSVMRARQSRLKDI